MAAMSALYDNILMDLLTVPTVCRLCMADMVGLDTILWDDTPGDTAIQEWLNSTIPRINMEADRVNGWIGTPNLPLARRVHMSRPTVDGVLLVTDYRALHDGYTPSRRLCRRWARVLADFLDLRPIPTRRFLTTPIVFLIGRLLVCYTGMYRFDLNRWPIFQRIGHRFRSNLYILMCHTNWRPIRNTIGVVTKHLVGMGL